MRELAMGINFQINIFVLEGLNILYLVQETFLHQNIEIFWKNIKSKGKPHWVRFFILLISAVIYKQRKLHENRGNAIFSEPVMQIIFLGPFWNTFIKIEQLKNLMALSLEGCRVSRQFQWFFWQYNNFGTENAIKLFKTIKESSHEHLNTYKTSSPI